MFIVHAKRGGKPMVSSDNNRLENGMLCQALQNDGYRLATEEEIKAYYPEYKPVKKATKKAEPKEEAKKDQ